MFIIENALKYRLLRPCPLGLNNDHLSLLLFFSEVDPIPFRRHFFFLQMSDIHTHVYACVAANPLLETTVTYCPLDDLILALTHPSWTVKLQMYFKCDFVNENSLVSEILNDEYSLWCEWWEGILGPDNGLGERDDKQLSD